MKIIAKRLLCGMCAVMMAACMLAGCAQSAGSDTGASNEPPVQSESPAQTEEQTEQEAEDTIDYCGVWYSGAEYDSETHEQELTIHSIDGDIITFSIFYYRLASYDYQTAVLDSDGIARFTIDDGYDVLTGSIELGESITVCIEQSTNDFILTGACEYTR